MDRFNINYPFVRIENRIFIYIESMNLIIGSSPDLASMGFKANRLVYERNVEKSEIDSAYYVPIIRARYRGYIVRVAEYKRDTNEIVIVFGYEDGEAAGIKPQYDPFDKMNGYYEACVPESEVEEIFEVREPEKSFPFESPRIAFHKKDGVWLKWHDLGAPLQDDEWI